MCRFAAVMSDSADDPLVLLEILEVLGVCRGRVSYADVCVYLSGRYELQPLLELRSLLYSTACRDPCFPATLFRERLHPPCSNRLSAAADVVSLFNLLTHTRLPPSHTCTAQSQTSCLACSQGCPRCDWLQAGGGPIAPGSKYEGSTEGSISMNTEALHPYTPSHFHAHMHAASYTINQDSMQSTHSTDLTGECPANQESSCKVQAAGSDTEPVYSCAKKRSVFKREFHSLLPFVPTETNTQSEQAQERLTDGGEDIPSLTYKNPYPDSALYTHETATHLHESNIHLSTHTQGFSAVPYMHVMQASDVLTQTQGSAMPVHDQIAYPPVTPTHTSFTSIHPAAQVSYQQKPKSADDLQSSTYFGPTVTERSHQSPAMAAKSHSLDIDSRPAEEGKLGVDKNLSRRPGSEKSALDKSGLAKPRLAKLSFDSSFDIPGFDPFIVRSVRDTLKRLSGLSLDAWYDCSPGADGMASVATQTEVPDRRALRSLMLSDKLSIDNPDIGEDDISAIFRFLDDISMCGSMAVLPGEGGGAQEGGGGGLPERRERLGKLRRLFHSLEGPEEGVRWGVGRLLQRVTELEQRLEPISELREQLALVLETLNRLEQRGQIRHTQSEYSCAHQQAASGCKPNVLQQQGSSRPNPEPEGANEAAAKRRGLFTRRASRSHTESSGSEQNREWSVSYSKELLTHPSQAVQQDGLCKKEVHPVQERRKSSHLITEAHRAPLHSSMPGSNLRLSDRPKVSWSQAELTPFDLQAPESLDFWMDDVYTPASDTLLRRSQSLTRCNKTQTYRITALSVTATVILILIIVIPIYTA